MMLSVGPIEIDDNSGALLEIALRRDLATLLESE